MSDREAKLLERWQRERPMYEAWGLFVSQTLTDAIARTIHPAAVDLFFRIPLKHRTKEPASLLAKAYHRGKPYEDPYEEIEDKVGLRIVVLFSEEIRDVERVIKSCTEWTSEKARDFEDERAQRPFEFDYQSLHYIVRSKAVISHGGIDIVPNTPCEIQVRTILQHAYSELTHDTIYKPSIKAQPDIKRAAAKSMALIEATDDYFSQVRHKLAQAQASGEKVTSKLDQLYRELINLEPDPSPLNTILIDYYGKWAKKNFDTEISEFLTEKSFLVDRIRERATGILLYRQPAILLVYWVIKQAPRAAGAADAPLSSDELEPLYSDLGARLPEGHV